MSSREKSIPPPILWPCAMLCFWSILLGNLLAYVPGVPADLPVYIVIAAFGLCGIFLCWRTIEATGISWRVGVCIILLLAAGKFVSWGLLLSDLRSFDDLKDKLSDISEHISHLDLLGRPSFASMEPEGHLTAASKLIFDSNKPADLIDARRHLTQIPTYAPEHATALTLFHVVDGRLSELNASDQKEPAVEIIDRKRSGNRLSLRIRNNTSTPVTSIEYSLSFFRTGDGMQLLPDRRGRMATAIGAKQTQTIELTDDLLNRPVYSWAGLIGWTFATGS